MKSSLVATRVSSVPFISLLLFGIAISNFPALAIGESVVSNDAKPDTPGGSLARANPSILMWTWRLSTFPSPTRIPA